jgi:hypothetical protein
MNAMHLPRSAVAIAVLVASSVVVCTAQAQGPVLKSSDQSQFDRWYGRAGGTAGADRIDTLNSFLLPPPGVSVSYDKDVAERTNMQRESAGNAGIGISYDAEVAARTNMGREQKQPAPAVAKSPK